MTKPYLLFCYPPTANCFLRLGFWSIFQPIGRQEWCIKVFFFTNRRWVCSTYDLLWSHLRFILEKSWFFLNFPPKKYLSLTTNLFILTSKLTALTTDSQVVHQLLVHSDKEHQPRKNKLHMHDLCMSSLYVLIYTYIYESISPWCTTCASVTCMLHPPMKCSQNPTNICYFLCFRFDLCRN